MKLQFAEPFSVDVVRPPDMEATMMPRPVSATPEIVEGPSGLIPVLLNVVVPWVKLLKFAH